MKISEKQIEKFIFYLLYIYSILLFGFIGIIAIISHKVNNDYIKLWKEIYLIIIIFFCYIKDLFFNKKNKSFIIVNLIIIYFFILFIYSKLKDINNFLIFYQIKTQLPVFLFYIFFSMKKYLKLNKNKFNSILNIITKLIIVSVILGVLEVLYPKFVVQNILKIPLNTRDAGVTTIFAYGILRPFGLFQNYVQFGEITFLFFLLINEKSKRNKLKNFLIKIILLIGIIFSTYKTCYLGLIFYIFYKLLDLLKFNHKLKAILLSQVFFVQIITYTTRSMYIFFKEYLKIESRVLEESLLGRIQSGEAILSELKLDVFNFLFGLGLGKNGTSKTMNRFLESSDNRLAIDSLFMTLLSNYGIVLTIIIIFYSIYLIYKEKSSLLQYVYIYCFFISFYLNNSFGNLNNVFLICLIILYEYKEKGEKNADKLY